MRRIDEIAFNADVSEKSIEAYLVKRVKELGGKALKYSNPSETGYPDRLVLLPNGRIFWAEIKSKGKKPRAIQVKRHKELERLGCMVKVVDSKELIDYILNVEIF